MTFYKVIRPFCDPGRCYTFAENKEQAILKINQQYGFVSNTRATPIVGDKLNSIIINGDD